MLGELDDDFDGIVSKDDFENDVGTRRSLVAKISTWLFMIFYKHL